MPRSDFLRLNFRRKLLLALLGTIGPLLLVTLLVVRREASHQVNAVVARTVRRAGDTFAQLERLRQQQLAQLGYRFASSNRLVAAILENDSAQLLDQTRYELLYAGVPDMLAVMTNVASEPLMGVLNASPLAAPEAALSTTAIDRLFAGDTAAFAYHVLDGRLFTVHPVFLYLEQPVGILELGSPIDTATATTLGNALNAEVCFAINGRCIATSTPIKAQRFERVTRPIAGAPNAQIVLRIPLDEVVRPFEQIVRAIRLIGLIMLVLAIGVALLLSHGLARPVRALVAATARVARGEYDTHVPVTTHDELGVLAGAFNDMTHGLMLKEQYRGVLDKVVSRDVADEMLKGEIQLGGETRVVTMLFADVRGFTAMSEEMDPHDVVSLLNEVMDHAEQAIVEEGGVVDKYVGDEIMALFGAPLSREDDALRAVRAAVRMQEQVAGINEARAREGKDAVSFGIGINTGPVVAGNMGSARRLNYTVLGAPVNLAARLCSDAQPGQILISQTTLDLVRDHVTAEPRGIRSLKGFSRDIHVFEVIKLAVLALMLMLPGRAFAQAPATTWTLGPAQIQPSARLDINAFVPASDAPGLIPETDPFLAGRASALADVFIGKHLYGLFELRLDRGAAPSNRGVDFRIEQAFLRITPLSTTDASLQIGRFVSPFGNYPQRHHSVSDPLIRPPLSYDYRTLVSATLFPATNQGFLQWRAAPFFFRPRGAPPIWSAPYQLGAMVLGTYHKFAYRIATMNTAPSSEPYTWNDLPGFADWSWVGNAALQLSPELRFGVSYNNGTYVDQDAPLPPGEDRNEFKQKIIGLEASYARGFVEIRGELFDDAWYVPNVIDEAKDLSFYTEMKVKLAPGAFVAARFGQIHFNELRLNDTPSSMRAKWDDDISRLQIGGGYRLSEAFEVRAEYMMNWTSGATDPSDNLFSVQASWSID